ncbi:hypothetical protein [Micromonospora zhanjiangensis]|uniref:Uncharacterized protein n=1 Tax=Micromonospora zhanjiangensis TaxID=1522057 RepID=A0ABV8KQW0_9ACTN
MKAWAYVLTEANDVLAANPEGLALLPGHADWPLGHVGTSPGAAQVHPTLLGWPRGGERAPVR